MLTAVAIGIAVAGLILAAWDGMAAPNQGALRSIDRELPATANPVNNPAAHNTPVLAADPTDPRFVVMASRVDAPAFGCSLHVSGDGGRTFIPAQPVPELPEEAERCYAPKVAFGPDGTLYYLFSGLSGNQNTPMGVFLTTSTDRAQTFTTPRQVLGPSRFSVQVTVDQQGADRGRLHLVWLEARGDLSLGSLPPPPNPILAKHSDDGQTFSEPVQVNDPDRRLVVAPALALGTDGAVHVLYYDLGGDLRDYHGLEGPVWEGTWSLALATSLDGGRHFSRHILVDNDVTPPERVMLIFTMPSPALSAGEDRRLYAAWHDARNGDWDAFLRRSTDGGDAWEGPVRVNDDPVGNGRHQYQPRVDVAANGRVDVVFYDRRHDPDNLRNQLSYAYSTDHGRSFAVNRRLTSQPSDPRIGQRYAGPAAEGLVEFGAHPGLLSRDHQAVAAWTDTRNALRNFRQDVFTNVVHFPEAASSGALPALVALFGGLVAGLAVLAGARRRRVLLTAGGLLLAAGCAPGTPAQALPPPPAIIDVSLDEYHIDHPLRHVPAGRMIFRVANEGTTAHELLVVRLPDDLPGTFDEQLHSEIRRPAATLGFLPALTPGDTGVFALDLAPGRYGLVCFQEDEGGEAHALKGMNSELVVEDRDQPTRGTGGRP